MKISRLILITGLIGIIPAVSFSRPIKAEREYDFVSSLTDAINNSNELLFAKQEIRLNKNRVKEARSLLYPHLSINANISKYTANEVYALSSELGSTLLKPTNTKADNFYASRMTLKKTIYTGGRVVSTLRLAQASLERAQSEYQEIKNNIIFRVTKTFYELLFLDKKEKLYRNVIKNFEGMTGPVKRKYKKSIYRVRMQALRADLDAQIAEYTHNTKLERLAFISTLNIEQGTIISIKGGLRKKFVKGLTLSKCLSWADQYRPELKQTRSEEEINALAVSLSMAERYPTILFGASYEFNGTDFPLDAENWNATLSLNFPIFDGWAGWARVRQKRAQREQGRYRKAQKKDAVHMEVRRAFSSYKYWHAQIQPREKDLKKSRGLISTLREDYIGGDISSDEFLDALVKLAEIEVRYLKSIKEEVIAYAKLEKATGKLLNGTP